MLMALVITGPAYCIVLSRTNVWCPLSFNAFMLQAYSRKNRESAVIPNHRGRVCIEDNQGWHGTPEEKGEITSAGTLEPRSPGISANGCCSCSSALGYCRHRKIPLRLTQEARLHSLLLWGWGPGVRRQ